MKHIICFLFIVSSFPAIAQIDISAAIQQQKQMQQKIMADWNKYKIDCGIPANMSYATWVAQGAHCPYNSAGNKQLPTPTGVTGPEQLAAQLGNLAGQALADWIFPSPEQKARRQAQQLAQQQLQQVQQQLQNETQLLYNSGMYYLKKKNYAGAINEFQLALAKNPNDGDIAKSLAFAKQQLKNTGVAAQNSNALTHLLGNAPPDVSKLNFDRLAVSALPGQNSPLDLVNLDANPNSLTKTNVNPSTQTAETKNTLQELDNVLNNGSSQDIKGQLNELLKNDLSQPGGKAASGTKNQAQSQNPDNAQSIKAIDQALGQNTNAVPGGNSGNTAVSAGPSAQTGVNPAGGSNTNAQQAGTQPAVTGSSIVALNNANQQSNAPLGSISNPDFDGRVGNAPLGKVTLSSASTGPNAVDLRGAGTTVVNPARVSGSSQSPVIINPSYPGFNAVKSQWSANACIAAVRQRDSLLKDQMRLTTLKENVNKKINELNKWADNLSSYKTEADQLRTEVANESFTNILGVLSDALDVLAGENDLNLQGISKKDRKIVKRFCEYGNMLAHGITGAESIYSLNSMQDESLHSQIETISGLYESVLAIPGLSHKERRAAEASIKTVEGITRLLIYAKERHPSEQWWVNFREWQEANFKPSLELAGVFVPYIAASVAAEGLGERFVNSVYAQPAIEESVRILDSAVKKDFSAVDILHRKIFEISDRLDKNNRMINAANTKIAGCSGN